jgi:hypothetical protein
MIKEQIEKPSQWFLRATPEPRITGRPTQISSFSYVTSIVGVRPVLKWGRVFPRLNRKHRIGEVFSLSHLAVLHSTDQVYWYELVSIKLSFFVFASFSFIQTCHTVQKTVWSSSSILHLETSLDHKPDDWRLEVQFSEAVESFSTATSSSVQSGAVISA